MTVTFLINSAEIERVNIHETMDVWLGFNSTLTPSRVKKWCLSIASNLRQELSFPTTQQTELLLLAIPDAFRTADPYQMPIILGVEIDPSNQNVLRVGVCIKHILEKTFSLDDLQTQIIHFMKYRSSMLQTQHHPNREKIEIRSNLVTLASYLPKACEQAMQQKHYRRVQAVMMHDSPEMYSRWKNYVDRLPSEIQQRIYTACPIFDDPKNRNARMWLLLAHAYVQEQSKALVPKIPSPWHMRLNEGVTSIIFDGQGHSPFHPSGAKNALFQIDWNVRRPMLPYIEWLYGKSSIKDIPHYIDQSLQGVYGFKEDYSLKRFFETRTYTSPDEVEGVIATMLYHDPDWLIAVASAQQLYDDITNNDESEQFKDHAIHHLTTSVFCTAMEQYIQSVYTIHRPLLDLPLPSQCFD